MSQLKLGLLLVVVIASEAAAAPVYGLARAKDGDSMMVGQTEVRLFGVDAPEFDQSCTRSGQAWACGAEAADRLSLLVTGKDVRCIPMGTDQYRRTLGRCTVGFTDVNRTMVATGYAIAYRRYSTDYVSAEEAAKVNRRGMWAGSFEMPSAYRREAPAASGVTRDAIGAAPARRRTASSRARPDVSSGACLIKGNRSRKGEWIYHVPGMPYYGPTRAEELFCSETEAQAAGYRRARVR